MVGVGLISVFTLFFVAATKSYSLVDADKIVEVLFSAINSGGGVYVNSEYLESVANTPSPVFFDGVVVAPSPSISGSPLVVESPKCEADLPKSIFAVLEPDEKRFLLPICEVYRKFFEQPINSPLLRNKKNLEYFKYAVLINLFEKAIERLRFEQINVERYKHSWWHSFIFSCTDEEAHTVGMLYQDFVQWGLFKSLDAEFCRLIFLKEGIYEKR